MNKWCLTFAALYCALGFPAPVIDPVFTICAETVARHAVRFEEIRARYHLPNYPPARISLDGKIKQQGNTQRFRFDGEPGTVMIQPFGEPYLVGNTLMVDFTVATKCNPAPSPELASHVESIGESLFRMPAVRYEATAMPSFISSHLKRDDLVYIPLDTAAQTFTIAKVEGLQGEQVSVSTLDGKSFLYSTSQLFRWNAYDNHSDIRFIEKLLRAGATGSIVKAVGENFESTTSGGAIVSGALFVIDLLPNQATEEFDLAALKNLRKFQNQKAEIVVVPRMHAAAGVASSGSTFGTLLAKALPERFGKRSFLIVHAEGVDSFTLFHENVHWQDYESGREKEIFDDVNAIQEELKISDDDAWLIFSYVVEQRAYCLTTTEAEGYFTPLLARGASSPNYRAELARWQDVKSSATEELTRLRGIMNGLMQKHPAGTTAGDLLRANLKKWEVPIPETLKAIFQ